MKSGKRMNTRIYSIANKKNFVPPSKVLYLDIIKKAVNEYLFAEDYKDFL